MGNYYVADGGAQRGPFPAESLRGQGLRPESLVWTEGMPQWQRAIDIPELRGFFVAAPGIPPLPVDYCSMTPGDVSGKKLACGICGILLGAFGVHRFILGDVGGGILRIVITVVTCGFGQVLGLVEGIIYLTKTDQQFYEEYILRKKAWF